MIHLLFISVISVPSVAKLFFQTLDNQRRPTSNDWTIS